MSIQTFFQSLISPSRQRRPSRRSRESAGLRPQLEALENRWLPSGMAPIAEPDWVEAQAEMQSAVYGPGDACD